MPEWLSESHGLRSLVEVIRELVKNFLVGTSFPSVIISYCASGGCSVSRLPEHLDRLGTSVRSSSFDSPACFASRASLPVSEPLVCVVLMLSVILLARVLGLPEPKNAVAQPFVAYRGVFRQLPQSGLTNQVGLLVFFSWMVLKLSGRWRPQPDWIDRTGRMLGVLWIGHSSISMGPTFMRLRSEPVNRPVPEFSQKVGTLARSRYTTSMKGSTREGRLWREITRASHCAKSARCFARERFRGATDGTLLDHFLGGRPELAEAAFTVLVLRHGPMVHRVCLGVLRISQDAEDAAQATFLALLKSASRVQKRDSIASWLHGTALRVSACVRKARLRKERHEAKASSLRVWFGTDDSVPADLIATIHQEIGKLPEAYRTAIVLCDLEGYSYEEAAARVDRPVGTIKSRVSRAREQLKAKLIRRGLSPVAGLSAVLAHGEANASVLIAWANATYRLATLAVVGGEITRILAVTHLYQRSLLMGYLKNGLAALAVVGVFTAGATLWAQQRGPGPGGAGIGGEGLAAPAKDQLTVVRTYSVADLVLVATTAPGKPGNPIDMKPLMEILATTVAPGTWGSNQGDQGWISEQPVAAGRVPGIGSIVPFHLSVSLIIRHTPEVHIQVEDRIRQLRRLTEARDRNLVKQGNPAANQTVTAPSAMSSMMRMDGGSSRRQHGRQLPTTRRHDHDGWCAVGLPTRRHGHEAAWDRPYNQVA